MFVGFGIKFIGMSTRRYIDKTPFVLLITELAP